MIKELILRIFALIASLFTAKQLGKSEANKKHAEEIAKERDEDAKIDSQPFVDKPLGRMRKRKKKLS